MKLDLCDIVCKEGKYFNYVYCVEACYFNKTRKHYYVSNKKLYYCGDLLTGIKNILHRRKIKQREFYVLCPGIEGFFKIQLIRR